MNTRNLFVRAAIAAVFIGIGLGCVHARQMARVSASIAACASAPTLLPTVKVTNARSTRTSNALDAENGGLTMTRMPTLHVSPSAAAFASSATASDTKRADPKVALLHGETRLSQLPGFAASASLHACAMPR